MHMCVSVNVSVSASVSVGLSVNVSVSVIVAVSLSADMGVGVGVGLGVGVGVGAVVCLCVCVRVCLFMRVCSLACVPTHTACRVTQMPKNRITTPSQDPFRMSLQKRECILSEHSTSTLQRTATHCNTLHHTAPRCTTRQHTAKKKKTSHLKTIQFIFSRFEIRQPAGSVGQQH